MQVLYKVHKREDDEEVPEEENINVTILSLQVWCKGTDGKV